MKKKLLAALSLTLACGFAFSTVACSKDKTEKDPPKRDPLDFSTATTNDEIYESLKAGLAASSAHTGGMTMTSTSNRETKTGDTVTYKRNSNSKGSFDPVTFVMYETQTDTYKYSAEAEEETSVETYKNFKEGDKYYSFFSEKEGNEEAESGYMEAGAKYTDQFAEEIAYTVKRNTAYFTTFVAADSAEDMQAAYSKVYGDSLTEEKKTNADATASTSYTLANNEGTLTATLTTAYASKYVHDNYTEEDTTDDVTVSYSVSATAVLTAKDGKITGFKQTTTNTEKRGEVTSITTNVEDMTIDYAFDKTGYDAITVSLPTDETQIMKDEPYYGVDLVYDGAYFNSASYYGDEEATAAKVIESWTTVATQQIAAYEGAARTVTLYTDEACTKALSSSATLEELEALEYLFVKTITPAADKALIRVTNDSKYELSKEYQIVYASNFASMEEDGYNYGYISQMHLSANPAENVYEFNEIEEDRTVNISVNGTATTEASFTMEAGKMYKIVYEYVWKDANLNVFKMYQD